MADIQIVMLGQDNIQLAIIDTENTQLALAAPTENAVNIAVPGIQGPTGATGDVAVAQNGTAALPGIRFQSDPNTGLYSPGADQLAISTGGTGRLFVDSSGRVGLGTTSPSQALDVVGTVNVSASSQAQYFGINAVGTSSGVANGLFAPTGNELGFITNVTERARIDSSGRLLVGTSTSASGGQAQYARLQVEGNTFGVGQGIVAIRRASSSSGLTASTPIGQIDFTDNAGEPYARIEAIADGATGTGDYPTRLVFSTTADGASTPTERLRIDSAGRIGINIAPTNATTIWIARNLTGNTTQLGVYNAGIVQSDVTFGNYYFTTAAQTAAAAFTLTNMIHYCATQSTFGAGSTVSNQYGFYAESNIVGATNNYGFYGNIPSGTGRWNFYAAGTADSYFASNNFIFANGGTEKARMDSSGRLLVGTSTDSGGALFQVNGDRIRVATSKTPASATAAGTAGEICWDANYIYVCIAANTWKRAAIATW